MNLLLKAYLIGCENMINAANDMERLKFMPQRVEDGVLYNFNDVATFGGAVPGIKDVVIFEDKERILKAQKCTSVLKRDYFKAFHSFLDSNPINDNGEVVEETVKENEDPLYVKLYDAVEDGDKKEVRSICKELEKKWFALDPEIVEDAIDDIKACVKSKNADEVKEIIKETIEDIAHVENEDGTTTKPYNNNDSEETLEIIGDIENALKDQDYDDVELLLKELGSDHPRYEEFEKQLQCDDDEETKEEDVSIDDILYDLDDAIKDKDFDGKNGAKVILEELKEVVGEDDEDYKKYYALVYPPVGEKTTRRSRRRGK